MSDNFFNRFSFLGEKIDEDKYYEDYEDDNKDDDASHSKTNKLLPSLKNHVRRNNSSKSSDDKSERIETFSFLDNEEEANASDEESNSDTNKLLPCLENYVCHDISSNSSDDKSARIKTFLFLDNEEEATASDKESNSNDKDYSSMATLLAYTAKSNNESNYSKPTIDSRGETLLIGGSVEEFEFLCLDEYCVVEVAVVTEDQSFACCYKRRTSVNAQR